MPPLKIYHLLSATRHLCLFYIDSTNTDTYNKSALYHDIDMFFILALAHLVFVVWITLMPVAKIMILQLLATVALIGGVLVMGI